MIFQLRPRDEIVIGGRRAAQNPEFRQFYCPACGGLLENEVCRAQDPLLWDIQLAADG